jgi:hypothetical protein
MRLFDLATAKAPILGLDNLGFDAAAMKDPSNLKQSGISALFSPSGAMAVRPPRVARLAAMLAMA